MFGLPQASSLNYNKLCCVCLKRERGYATNINSWDADTQKIKDRQPKVEILFNQLDLYYIN